MLSARYSVILDCGHGPGTRTPTGARHGRWVERDVVRRVAAEAGGALAEAGVSVRVVTEGSYRDRQRDPLVATADLYLAVHCDIQGSRTPYALTLALPASRDAAERLASVYAQAAGLRRWESGEPGSFDWPNGRALIDQVPEHLVAMVLELGSLSHASCDILWTDAARTGRALATAVQAVVPRDGVYVPARS